MSQRQVKVGFTLEGLKGGLKFTIMEIWSWNPAGSEKTIALKQENQILSIWSQEKQWRPKVFPQWVSSRKQNMPPKMKAIINSNHIAKQKTNHQRT